MPQPDDALVVRAQQGDKDAFGQLYTRYFDKIFRFVYASVRNRELSEDLAQNTFLKCWRSLSRFSTHKGTFQAFVFAIARNLLIDWYRKKKPLPLWIAERIPSREDVEEHAIKNEAKGEVWNALFHLRKEERHLIILRYFEEMPYGQIAQVVGKNEGTVRVRIYRILKTLKKHMKKV